MQNQKGRIIVVIILALLFFSGCSKLNEENYNKIKIGMDYSEVLGIFGEAEKCTDSLMMKDCMWGSAEKYIKINFVADKVISASKNGL